MIETIEGARQIVMSGLIFVSFWSSQIFNLLGAVLRPFFLLGHIRTAARLKSKQFCRKASFREF